MTTVRPLVEVEARALTRFQLMERIAETHEYWERRFRSGRPLTRDELAAEAEFSVVVFEYVRPGGSIAAALRFVKEGHHRTAGDDYWNQRVDGSPARAPRRVRRTRIKGTRAVPYGCKLVDRTTEYGNPFTVEEYGDQAVPEFRRFIGDRGTDRGRWPGIQYPSMAQIVADLGGWDLACWCQIPDGPYISPARPDAFALGHVDRCHADVLLRVSNGGTP